MIELSKEESLSTKIYETEQKKIWQKDLEKRLQIRRYKIS